MATHKDLLAKDKDLKAEADRAVTASEIAHSQISASIFAAPGHAVVDVTVTPHVLYTSADGKDYATTEVGSVEDTVIEGTVAPGDPSAPIVPSTPTDPSTLTPSVPPTDAGASSGASISPNDQPGAVGGHS